MFDVRARDYPGPASAPPPPARDGRDAGGDFLDRLAQAEVRDSIRVPSGAEQRLRDAFARADANGSGCLSVARLRGLLIQSGGSANEAKRLVDAYDTGGRGGLDLESFLHAWQTEGLGPPSGA